MAYFSPHDTSDRDWVMIQVDKPRDLQLHILRHLGTDLLGLLGLQGLVSRIPE